MSAQTKEALKRAVIYLVVAGGPVVEGVLSGAYGAWGSPTFDLNGFLRALWAVLAAFLIRALGEGSFDAGRAAKGDVIAGDVGPLAPGRPLDRAA